MASKIKGTILRAGALAFILCAMLGSSAHAASGWLGSISSDVPTRIAVDGRGNVYVTEARERNSLVVYDRRGKELRTLRGLKQPGGVAVDGQDRIYVCNTGAGSVNVYGSDLTYSHSLGIGAGEFKWPMSVAVSAAGQVYVVDTKANSIRVYNANGTFAYTFGGWGQGNGKFNEPHGLAINESAGELYVTDFGIFIDGSNGQTAGARVQVFDLQGVHQRSFGTYGTGEGKMIRPVDVALDVAGRVYVADSFQGVIHVFNASGMPAETIFDRSHPTKTAIGLAVGRDNRVFIATANQKNVDVFGMSGYTTLDVAPAGLAFSAAEGSGATAAKTATISTTGTGSLEWSAATDRQWIAATPASGSAAPTSTLSISANAAGLTVGEYRGAVTVTAASGAVETVGVTLTVVPPPAVLSVAPAGLAFTAQQGGPAPAARSIDIRNLSTSGAMAWTAAKTAAWLTVSAAGGSATFQSPSSLLVSIAPTLPAGTYSDTVTITAPGAQNSPARVGVTVTVRSAGTAVITTNLSQARFTITGPMAAPLSGSGTLWKNDDLQPGKYTVSFEHAPGHRKPRPKTFTVTTGQETAVQAAYEKKAAATHLVTVTGGVQDKTVTIQTLGGAVSASFKPFAHPTADVQALVGAVTGTGASIIVTDSDRTIKLFSPAGAEQGGISLPKWHKNAVIAVGDIDGDGIAELLIGSQVKQQQRKDGREVRLYRAAAGAITEQALLYSDDKDGAFSLALGDLDGDLTPELLLADSSGVNAFTITGATLAARWTVQGAFTAAPKVACGDLDDDGSSEIVLSAPGAIQALSGAGMPTGAQISAASGKKQADAASVACGDVDGDGADEIAVGSTGEPQAPATVQVYRGDGTAQGGPITLLNSAGSGATVGLGSL